MTQEPSARQVGVVFRDLPDRRELLAHAVLSEKRVRQAARAILELPERRVPSVLRVRRARRVRRVLQDGTARQAPRVTRCASPN